MSNISEILSKQAAALKSTPTDPLILAEALEAAAAAIRGNQQVSAGFSFKENMQSKKARTDKYAAAYAQIRNDKKEQQFMALVASAGFETASVNADGTKIFYAAKTGHHLLVKGETFSIRKHQQPKLQNAPIDTLAMRLREIQTGNL